MIVKTNLLFLPILFFSCVAINGQNRATKKIDSLLKIENIDWDLDKNIKFLENLYASSEKIKYETGQYRSLLKMAHWYMLKGQYEKAIVIYERIDKQPLNLPENDKYRIKAIQDKAIAFTNLGLYNDAQVAINKSFLLIPKLDDTEIRYELKGNGYDNQANIYIQIKKPEDSVLLYLKKAVSEYKNIKNAQTRLKKLRDVYINISTSFQELKKIDSALFYSYKVLAMKDIGDEANSYVYQSIGTSHLLKNNLDSALIYYKKSESILKKTGDPIALKAVYQTLSEIYEKLNDKENSLLYSRKQIKLLDSLSSIEKKGVNKALQVIKKDIQQENNESKNKLYVIIGGILIILCVIIFFLWKFFKNFRQERKARLQNEEVISEKTSELNYTKSKVNESFEEVLVLAKKNDPAFFTRFKDVYPEFYEALLNTYPDINTSDLVFCAYLKLKFSTKEIANYTFVTTKAV